MTEQDLKIAESISIFFESLPDIVRNQVLERYFEKHQEKLEDFIFYLGCKERKESLELVGSEALFKTLKERL